MLRHALDPVLIAVLVTAQPATAQWEGVIKTSVSRMSGTALLSAGGGESRAVLDKSLDELRVFGLQEDTLLMYVSSSRFLTEFDGGFMYGDYASSEFAMVNVQGGWGIKFTPETIEQFRQLLPPDAMEALQSMGLAGGAEPAVEPLGPRRAGEPCQWYELTQGESVTRFCAAKGHPALSSYRRAMEYAREMFPMVAQLDQSIGDNAMLEYGMPLVVKSLTRAPMLGTETFLWNMIESVEQGVSESELRPDPDLQIDWITPMEMLQRMMN